MQHYVPGIILQECEAKRYAGSITAFVLFFDIADFTEMSNKFRRSGSKGAEALSNYLTAAFAYPIMQVESHGGFISHFAGDAFCAMFPGSDCRAIRQALSNIQTHFADIAYHDPELGEFPISIRLTLTYGEVEWKILRNKVQHEYVFSGSPLQEIYSLSSYKEVCMLSQAVQKAFAAAAKRSLEVVPLSYDFSETTRQLFTKAKLADLEVENEIRDAAYCFADLSRIEDSSLEGVIESIHTKLEDYSGFLNKIDATDKGLVALVLFGLPKAIGNTLERMCRFALEMIIEEPKLSMGLACGSAYAGFVGFANTREFTALGSAVNLASRLMQKAGAGEIVTDSYLQQEMHNKYCFAASEPVKFKGFMAEVHSHNLLGRLPRPPQSFHTDFVGREAEIAFLRQEAKEPGSRIIYISGEPGMGKSRLIIEALKAFPQSYFLFSDPSVHRLLEPIKQLAGQYFAIDPLLSKQRKRELFRQQWQELAQDDKELIRIESIIGQLLGYEWERSVWSVLPPEEKPEQLKSAFVSFVSRITRDEKLIIHLDDPQWLDDSTLEYFRLLGEKKVNGVTVFAACRYLDDGSAVDLEIPNWESKYVHLNLLTPESAAVMIKQILGVESIPEDSLDWIVRKADGNPLFLEQVVAYLKENSCFDAEHKLVGNLDYLSSFGIADIIGGRIDSLTDNVRNTLQHACVLGLEFNTRVLCKMLSRKLDEDLGKGKQAKVWADLDELRYIFTHVLVKDTAYNRMLSDKLKSLHLLAAEAMVKLYKDDEKALDEHSEEIAIHFRLAGEELEAAMYYDMAGVFYTESFLFSKAENVLQGGLGIRVKILGEENHLTLELLNNLAVMYSEWNKYDTAENLHSRVLELKEKLYGVKHLETALSLNNLASLFRNQGKLVEAEDFHIRALKVREHLLPSDHPDIAVSRSNLALVYVDQGKYELARFHVNRALRAFYKHYGFYCKYVAVSLDSIACIIQQQGDFHRAEKLFGAVLKINEILFGINHPETARSYNNLAALYVDQGRYSDAEFLYRKSLLINISVFGKEHISTISTMSNMGNLFQSEGRYDFAEQYLKDAICLAEKVFCPSNYKTAIIISNLAALYSFQDRISEAIMLFKQVSNILLESFGENHPSTAMAISNLAHLLQEQGDYQQALELNQKVLHTRENILGKSHPHTLSSLNNIAVIYTYQNRFPEAEEIFRSVIEYRMHDLGEDHPDTANAVFNLGVLYLKQGRESDSEIQHLQALAIWHKLLGPENPNTQKTIKHLVSINEKLGRSERADEYKAMLLPTEE
jgi:tetratricopeptide (TPR) repeat protein/class 3 adenylate cyclase